MKYRYLILQTGSLPLTPDNRLQPAVEHRATSLLIWPAAEEPTAHNSLLVDPCFTPTGFKEAKTKLAELNLAFSDLNQLFITHRHHDHLPNLSLYLDSPPELTLFRENEAGPLAGISTAPCPGHSPDMTALRFWGPDEQDTWVTGDAILNRAWLMAWAYYWPNRYSEREIIQTWQSVSQIIAGADLIIPGHGPPLVVTDALAKELRAAFAISAAFAPKCPEVGTLLQNRLNQPK